MRKVGASHTQTAAGSLKVKVENQMEDGAAAKSVVAIAMKL